MELILGLEDVRKLHPPLAAELPLPVPATVHVHHAVGDGVILLLEPQWRVCSLALKPCGCFVVSVSCSFCCSGNSCLTSAALCTLLLLQSNLHTL